MVNEDRKILLVVDVQESLCTGDTDKVLQYVKDHGKDYDEIIAFVCTFAVENFSRFAVSGTPASKEHTPLIREAAPGCRILVTGGYGIPDTDLDDFAFAHTDVIGCGPEAGILAAAFQLFDCGYDFSVLTDYCYSTAGEETKTSAIVLMKKLFGKAIT